MKSPMSYRFLNQNLLAAGLVDGVVALAVIGLLMVVHVVMVLVAAE